MMQRSSDRADTENVIRTESVTVPRGVKMVELEAALQCDAISVVSESVALSLAFKRLLHSVRLSVFSTALVKDRDAGAVVGSMHFASKLLFVCIGIDNSCAELSTIISHGMSF